VDRGVLWSHKEVVPCVCRTCVGDDAAINTLRKAKRPFQCNVSIGATIYGNEDDIVAIDMFVDEDVALGVQSLVTPRQMA
jgi:hypothetical protein